MSRDSSGAYTLPASNPVVTLTTVASSWANATMADLAAELTNSLDRQGRGAMLAPLQAYNGSVLAPGMTWAAETNSGWYRVAAGSFRYSIAGVDEGGIGTDGWTQSDGAGNLYRVGFREVPQVSFSAAYAPVLSDAGKHLLHPAADVTARVVTIPANAAVAFPVGTAFTIVNQNGAGVLTIAITSDTQRLAGTGATGSRTLAANGIATWLKIAATEWICSGTGLT